MLLKISWILTRVAYRELLINRTVCIEDYVICSLLCVLLLRFKKKPVTLEIFQGHDRVEKTCLPGLWKNCKKGHLCFNSPSLATKGRGASEEAASKAAAKVLN